MEAPEVAGQDGEQVEEGEFSKMLSELDQEEAVPEEAAGSSKDSKANVVETDDMEALVDHWFEDPIFFLFSLRGKFSLSCTIAWIGFFLGVVVLSYLFWYCGLIGRHAIPRCKFHNGSLISWHCWPSPLQAGMRRITIFSSSSEANQGESQCWYLQC